jgi:hypothetical protein
LILARLTFALGQVSFDSPSTWIPLPAMLKVLISQELGALLYNLWYILKLVRLRRADNAQYTFPPVSERLSGL